MKKILFINPSLRPDAMRKYPPVGLAFILKAVKNAGIDYDLIDMDASNLTVDDLKRHIQNDKYDIYAIGCIVTGLKIVSDISTLIKKENPNATIIAGNSVATSIPELLLRNTDVDIAVIGEGDITIVELLGALIEKNDLSSVKGIAYLENNQFYRTKEREIIKSLDNLGFPEWNLFEIRKYNDGMLNLTVDDHDSQIVFPLNAARGCPFNCTFCYHVFKGKPYRKYSVESIVNEIKRLKEKYHATFIHFWDELTFPNINSVKSIVKAMEDFPIKVGWQGITRADLFTGEDISLIKRLKNVGCKSIAFSIENASPEILKAMNKKLNYNRVIENSLALHQGEITPLTSIIFGYPQETPETIKMTIDLCRKCNIFPSVGFLQPLPGTQIYEYAKENNIIANEFEYLINAGDRQDLHVNLTNMPDDEFIDCVMMEMNCLAKEMGLKFKNPLKTGVYQKSNKRRI